MEKAKLFKNGSSQAVRLPKEFRFTGSEVYIRKIGDMVVLIPRKSAWADWLSNLSDFSDDFMIERNQPEAQERDPL
ncbi:type II toxin-antitoxin system antitoxin VapB [Leptonema illini]|jgi:antitoxin VapB|uniref:SpoVT/AbrB domain-containing protein n=1 Tax=Leptonema illini DSM 21528 TaxID=929563 RepID=H2CBX5_9LEPT|nr:AbrB/MazE/SpoVT family DNA-binding domain-containing protein [Leptonema illini]EHQ08647.1 SpoVT/AbrB domain-containing protein [Leptonema illini DSM 21528]